MLLPTSTVMRLLSIGGVCALSTLGCAFNRAEVKSLRDPTAARIQFDAPVDTTISALNAIPSKCGPTGNHRVRDEELRVYRIEGTVTRVKRERDHDIHIVLADPRNPADHMVVESDDSQFGKNTTSPYHDRLAAARDMFDALVSESSGDRLDALKSTMVRVTGVGFFDFNHLQVGRSRSCIELHPILTIERVNAVSTEQTPDAECGSPRQAHLWRTPHGLAAPCRIEASAGRLTEAEASEDGGPGTDVTRVAASATYHSAFRENNIWATPIGWGRNEESGHASNALLIETNLTLDERHAWFGRFEAASKTAD